MKLRALLVLSLSLAGGCVCVDPSDVMSFSCDSDGGCSDALVCCDGLCLASCQVRDGGAGGAGGGQSLAGGAAGGGTAGGAQAGGSAQGGGDAGGSAQGGGDAGGSAQGGGNAGGSAQGGGSTAGGSAQGGGSAGGSAQGGGSATIATGQPCVPGVPCASGICAQGRCCDRTCSGACESCAQTGREGSCAVLPEGTAASCSPFVCDGQPGCPTMCTSSRQCANGSFCDSGTCRPTRAAGQVCTANLQCTSGSCANGVCCSTPCTGSCDRCDLMPAGTCRPSPVGDPGEPLCGGNVTCNGTNVDCPIPCTAGCPSTTYCSGTLCAAKKPEGSTCGMAAECVSGNCVDGVCCNSACGGGASGDCQVCNRAGSVGTCAVLGSSVECRASTNTCDAPERCDGASPVCPADAITARNGSDCGSTTSWSAVCTPGAGTCPTTGTEAGSSTSRTCMSNACVVAGPQVTSRGCAYNPVSRDCGTSTTFGNCAQTGGVCSTTGTQPGVTTPRTCSANGQCVTGIGMGTSQACTFNPAGTACGTNTVWSGMCVQTGGACSTTGTEAGTINSSTCNAAGACPVTGSVPTSRACTFNPNGTPCGTNTAWTGTCAQSSAGGVCTTSGTEAGTISSSTCNAAGACLVTGNAGTSRACTFDPSGIACGSTTAWSGTCSPPSGETCSLSGTETGTITNSTCSTTGGCVAGMPSGTTRPCTRTVPPGQSCASPVCLNCNGPGDACGDFYLRVCSGGMCVPAATPFDICQCPNSGSFCPL
ncbi:MAG: hypothetical protein Q8L14_23415 [Myxococcales bacterium]|nr:hypothetical protein [Myxococcales bacterium]